MFFPRCNHPALRWTFDVTQRKVIMSNCSEDYCEPLSLTVLSAVTLPLPNESVSDSPQWLPDALTIRSHVIISGLPLSACHLWLVVVGIVNNYMSVHFREVEVKQVGWILEECRKYGQTHDLQLVSRPSTSIHLPSSPVENSLWLPSKPLHRFNCFSVNMSFALMAQSQFVEFYY